MGINGKLVIMGFWRRASLTVARRGRGNIERRVTHVAIVYVR
jgi:Fe2+ transport system protein FeoA